MVIETSSRIFLAYDGSINGDWVSRYAIRIATHTKNRKLFLLHILDGSHTSEEVRVKIKAIADECAFHHVELGHALLPLRKNVARTILDSIPPGSENFCICGARIVPRGKGYLTGTISEDLLRAKAFNAMAIRVVQPGLLGCPQDLLIPLLGTRARYEPMLPIARLLACDIRNVHFLRLVHLNALVQRYISRSFIRSLKKKEFAAVGTILAEMKKQQLAQVRLSGRVIVSADWVHDTLVQASRLHAQLVLLEAVKHFPFPNWLQDRQVERLLRNATCDIALFRTL